ncbi:MAG: hypothetical protein HY396_00450 [Candidatus Doudnabacteria bacterium]|nr:hypothetical protein [Candidatus Doudnabacteria bacterium]
MRYNKYYLLVIIVALTVALVYVVVVPRSEENGTPAPSPTPSPAPQDETAGWKTYRNDEYGFEVKYPEDWGTAELTSGGTGIIPLRQVAFYPSDKRYTGENALFEIWVYENTKAGLDAVRSRIFPKTVEPFEKRVEEEVRVGGQEGKELIAKRQYSVDGEVFTHRLVYVQKNNSIFVFYPFYPFGIEGIEEVALLGQILSTFRFVK